MSEDKKIFTVTEINLEAKGLLENLNVWVKGEVQEYNSSPNWWYNYLVLQDEKSQIKCVVTSEVIQKSGVVLQAGKEICVFAQATLYAKRGDFQLKILEIEELGQGKLQKQIEELKIKLQKEGLFDESRKRALPEFPQKIGLVTSKDGAASKDFIKILGARFPLAEVILHDVFVQGDKCAKSVVSAINYFNQKTDIDVLVVTRGGGSLEDLMGYNSEEIARAIASSKIPVVVAIGHEKDVTIAELVADHRSSTPSNAAEEVAPDMRELMQSIDMILSKILKYQEKTSEMQKYIDKTLEGIIANFKNSIELKKNNIDRFFSIINSLSPQKLLTRGYAIAHQNGKIMKSKHDVAPNSVFDLQFNDGRIKAKRIKK